MENDKMEEKINNEEFKNKCRLLYPRFQELNKHVPENVIIRGLAKVSEERLFRQVCVYEFELEDYCNYIVLEKLDFPYKDYLILIAQDEIESNTNKAVYEEIIKYYYPEVYESFQFDYSNTYKFGEFYLDAFCGAIRLNVIKINIFNIIFGDDEGIIQLNVPAKGTGGNEYFSIINKNFSRPDVQTFLEYIRSRRNPEAIVLST